MDHPNNLPAAAPPSLNGQDRIRESSQHLFGGMSEPDCLDAARVAASG